MAEIHDTTKIVLDNLVDADTGKPIVLERPDGKTFTKEQRNIFEQARITGRKSGQATTKQFKEIEKVTLEYCLKFNKGFDFSKGGKLPGLCGGSRPTGGQPRNDGFSSRLMWRENGAAEVYLYHPYQKQQFGLSIPFNFNFEVNREYIVKQEFDNGKIITKINDNEIICDAKFKTCNGILFHVFRGGSSLDWISNILNEITISKCKIKGGL